MNAHVWFLLQEAAIPLVVALVLLIGRRSFNRALLLLSGAALLFAIATSTLFGVEYISQAFSSGYLLNPSPGVRSVETFRNITQTIYFLLSICAWLLALYDSSRSRRWGWFFAILCGAVVSYVSGGIALSEAFMRELDFYDQLMSDHFLQVSIILALLSNLSVVLTLLYAALVRLPADSQVPDAAAVP